MDLTKHSTANPATFTQMTKDGATPTSVFDEFVAEPFDRSFCTQKMIRRAFQDLSIGLFQFFQNGVQFFYFWNLSDFPRVRHFQMIVARLNNILKL